MHFFHRESKLVFNLLVQVMVLENGVTKWFALGIVFDDYMHSLPGKTQGTVGFHTGERTIWTTDEDGTLTKMQTRGMEVHVAYFLT